MSKDKNLKEARAIFTLAVVSKRILCKIFLEKLRYQVKLEKKRKVLISVFAYFVRSTRAKKLFLQRHWTK